MYFGKKLGNYEEIYIDRIEQYMHTGNANMMLLGTSGTGKTQMCFREIKEFQGIASARRPIKVYYFTPDESTRIYEAAILFARKVQSDSVKVQIHTFCELDDVFLVEEGLYPEHDESEFRPNFIYLDGIDLMTLEKLTFLEKTMRGINGYRNIFTICMQNFLPIAKYRKIFEQMADICILGPISKELKDIYPLNLLGSADRKRVTAQTVTEEYGCICRNGNRTQNIMFLMDTEGLPIGDCNKEELYYVI